VREFSVLTKKNAHAVAKVHANANLGASAKRIAMVFVNVLRVAVETLTKSTVKKTKILMKIRSLVFVIIANNLVLASVTRRIKKT
jgi:hypothetical protein